DARPAGRRHGAGRHTRTDPHPRRRSLRRGAPGPSPRILGSAGGTPPRRGRLGAARPSRPRWTGGVVTRPVARAPQAPAPGTPRMALGALTVLDVRTERAQSVPWGERVTIGRGDGTGRR